MDASGAEKNYPNTLRRTCKGVSGYIYRAEMIADAVSLTPL